jgi:ATP-dependent helicase/nuclease subunit A
MWGLGNVGNLFDFAKETEEGAKTEEVESLPPDWEARERALDVRQSWIVEAPAGSGKTGLLVQRFLKLLGDESVEMPDQVLAVTFTVKATSEMRERVMAQLEAAARGDALRDSSAFERETRALAEKVLVRDAGFGWRLLETPQRLRIRTIDSLCAEIARLLPVLSGGGGRLAPVTDAAPMYREAARHTLMQLGGADAILDEALRVVLLHRDGNLLDCERLLMQMLELRSQWGELVPLGRDLDDAILEDEVLPRLQQTLEQIVCAGLTEFAAAVPHEFLQRLCSLTSSLAHIEPYGMPESPIAVCSSEVGLPSNDAADLEHWRALIHMLVTPTKGTWRKTFAKNTMGFETTKPQKAAIKELVEEVEHRDDLLAAIKRVNKLPPTKYPEDQWRVAKALFRVLSRALAELQLVFARSGECDFAELGLLAQTALEREGAVEDLNAALGMRLEHMLVDEVQDTSTSQYRLIELLTQGWDGQSQTAFLVGDPKQSIYMFRQARVERFMRTMQTGRLGSLPLQRLRLTANFRSQRSLVKRFNDDFSLLFPRMVSAANPEDVPYVEAQAVRRASESGVRSVVWHARLLEAQGDKELAKRERQRMSRLEATEVRAVVERWRARPLPEGRSTPWKIAVLVRSRNVLTDIVDELKNEMKGTIPFRAVEIEELGERREVLDLFALTRALLHPADRVAWLAVLHAPWCGLGLAELHVLAGADDTTFVEKTVEELMNTRGDLLGEEGCERLGRVWTVMQAAREHRTGLTMSQWVERTWRSLGGDAYLNDAEMTNARRYLELLDEVEEQTGGTDLAQLKRRLDRLYANPDTSDYVLEIMTIHKAKGLEWDVVMVPSLEKRAPSEQGRLLDWNEVETGDEEGSQIMLAPIKSKGEGSKELNSWLQSIEMARASAERKRMFYVACTRAREELHLFGLARRKIDGEIKPEPRSLLDTAWPAAARHFEGVSSAASASRARKNIVKMLTLPLWSDSDESVINLAAAGGDLEAQRPPILQRLPLGFRPETRLAESKRLSYGEEAVDIRTARFERPEGSFEARVFGNAVHVFIEKMTQKLAEGISPDALRSEVAGWSPRVAAVLRAEGLPPVVVERLTGRVKTALGNMLQDAEGRWVLQAQEEAASELALTSWGEQRMSVRMDRVFVAGAAPLTSGKDFLWVVDYKTSTHGREGVEEFLAAEREKYGAQMETYARVMQHQGLKLRLGMYYPMLPKLIWWEAE